jgi:peptide/nickel transport system substrate-binding protein
VAYEDVAWSFLHLMGDGLVAFEPTGGTNPKLVPDLATSVPTPTDGGRMYRFELRSGIRYSNGEVAAPSDFRRAIERVFHLQSGGSFLFTGLVGGETCANEPRTCDLSGGIRTDGNSITFHLVEPDPEFLYKLTMTFAHPVPPSTPDEEQVRAGIPGTGPYMLEAPMTDERLALVRNPHFRVWSQAAQPDGYVDRIEWTFPVKPRAQVEAVRTGEADVTFGPSDSDGLEEISVQYPAQVHSNPGAWTYFVVLNTEVPPFDNVDVRKAINLALDRDRVVQIFGGEGAGVPTCQQLPPNFPGYEPYCPYTMDPAPEGEGLWTAPDLEEAKRIVGRSATRGMRVTFEYPEAYWKDGGGELLGEYMLELLEELGYHGEVRPLPVEGFYSPSNEFHMALAAWGLDYPAASTFISPFLTCSAPQTPRSGFCDRGIDVMIERATQMQVEDPVASGALWAETERKIVDQAPHLWLVNPVDVKFVSERVGNYQYGLQWGVLFNQLWVQ